KTPLVIRHQQVLVPCSFILIPLVRLDQIEKGKYKYPNQVHKVPVQTDFFHHEVTTPTFKSIVQGHTQHNNIEYQTDGHVQTVKTGNRKKQVGKLQCRCVRDILRKIGLQCRCYRS